MKKPMKILVIVNEYPPMAGGGGKFTEAFVKEFARSKEVSEVCVITAETGKKIPTPKEKKIKIIPLRAAFRRNPRKSNSINRILTPFVFMFQAVKAGRRELKRKRYDLLWSVFSVPSGVAGSVLSRESGIPHAVTTIGTDVYEPTKWYSPHRNLIYGWIVRQVLKRAHLITAISEDIRKKVIRYFNPDRPVITAHIGFTPFPFKKVRREKLGLEKNAYYLIYVNRIVPRKGHKYLLEALSRIKDENIKLIVVGEGPEKEKLRELAKELHVEKRVVWTGYVSEEKKWQHLTASDLYVSSSLHEGFGINILEAMHAGLPVVSTNKGGQTDFLEEGKNALLVAPKSPEELCSAILKLRKDNKLAKEMAKQNKEKAKALTTHACANNYLRLFKRIALNGQKGKQERPPRRTGLRERLI
ncbi:glycosyltransferase family 1 protein [Candidatus Woesearchaeota archaeon]|nr:MAG: glycosyltransferase family 1 protein [Candidatus Woesearchaeota archaeon]